MCNSNRNFKYMAITKRFCVKQNKVQIKLTKTLKHTKHAINTHVCTQVLIHSYGTVLSTVRWVEYISAAWFLYWAARRQQYNMSIGICLSVCAWIRASPSRLLLLFKGLAAPSPLKQKEKRDWVRLPPSDQNTSSKTIGGKKQDGAQQKTQGRYAWNVVQNHYPKGKHGKFGLPGKELLGSKLTCII